MAGTVKRLAGPVAMSATLTTNIYNQSSALIFDLVKHIHIVNKTAGAVTFSLWLGATGGNAAGTEIAGSGRSIPANSAVDLYFGPGLKMTSTDFLVGGASAGTSLAITVMGEQFVL